MGRGLQMRAMNWSLHARRRRRLVERRCRGLAFVRMILEDGHRMAAIEEITTAPEHDIRRAGRGAAACAAGAVAARLCGIDAVLARAGDRSRLTWLSRGRAEPARLFAPRAA